MHTASLAFLLSLNVAAGIQQEPLGVLRATPQEEAMATAAVRVTFDRPVAGGLGGSIDPATIFAIEPAAPGKVDWRDPVTIRFVPDVPLTSLTTYTVTIYDAEGLTDTTGPYDITVTDNDYPTPLAVNTTSPSTDDPITFGLNITDNIDVVTVKANYRWLQAGQWSGWTLDV